MFDKAAMDQIVSAAIVAALGEQSPKLLSDLVDKVINKKVNGFGGDPKYGDEQMTMLEYVARDQLQRIMAEAVKEWFQVRHAQIKQQIIDAINEGNFAEDILKKFAAALEYSNVKIQFDNNVG